MDLESYTLPGWYGQKARDLMTTKEKVPMK